MPSDEYIQPHMWIGHYMFYQNLIFNPLYDLSLKIILEWGRAESLKSEDSHTAVAFWQITAAKRHMFLLYSSVLAEESCQLFLVHVSLEKKMIGEIIRAPWRDNVIIHKVLWAVMRAETTLPSHVELGTGILSPFFVSERNVRAYSGHYFYHHLNPSFYIGVNDYWLPLMKIKPGIGYD